jgi:chlorobactene glucosyltransferase
VIEGAGSIRALMSLYLEYTLFALYVLVGPIAWGVMIWAMFQARERLMLLEKSAPLGAGAPPLTVMIPARNEAVRIEGCVRSVLSQDYPDLRVLAVDDRSDDGTGEIFERLAREDQRLAVVRLGQEDLEAGWMPKNSALTKGYARVMKARPLREGEFLLMLDSDVKLTRADTISRMVAAARQRDAALLSLLPALESGSFFEGLVLPLGGMVSSTVNMISLTNVDEVRNVAYANGQCLMIRRDVYEEIGGHANPKVRARVCEDVALARIVKSSGRRVKVAWGAQWCSVRMYDSLGAIHRGLGRIFADSQERRAWPMVVGILFLLVCGFSLYAAAGWAVWRWFHPLIWGGALGWTIAAGMHLALMTMGLSLAYVWSGNRWWNALLFPIGGAVLISIYLRGIRIARTGKVQWRGGVFRLEGT